MKDSERLSGSVDPELRRFAHEVDDLLKGRDSFLSRSLAAVGRALASADAWLERVVRFRRYPGNDSSLVGWNRQWELERKIRDANHYADRLLEDGIHGIGGANQVLHDSRFRILELSAKPGRGAEILEEARRYASLFHRCEVIEEGGFAARLKEAFYDRTEARVGRLAQRETRRDAAKQSEMLARFNRVERSEYRGRKI